MKTKSFQHRIRFIFGAFVLFALVMLVRLYFLQIVHGEYYSDKANSQYVNVVNDTFDRGSIFFTSKDGTEVTAAGLQSGYTVAINNTVMATDTDEYYAKLSAILPLDKADFYAKAAKTGAVYNVIADKVPEDQVQKIDALNLPGVVIAKEKWRYYPGSDLASRVIGFVAYDDTGTNLVGRYGLENYYDSTLSRNDSNVTMNTFAGLFSDIRDNFLGHDESEGDVVTGIDPEVQGFVEKEIAAANAKWHSAETGAIVIDPASGQIDAMGMYPNFNLNDFRNQTDVSIYADPLVSNAYEMGSIVKPLTLAAGIDSGAVTATTTYDDTGSITVDGKTIHNFDGKARGIIPLQVVINESLNVGASFIATKMGKPTMLDYFQAFGLGQETGIDLPDEAAGDISNLVDNLNNQKQVEYDTASFGQGISMTPIDTVRALCILANGGKVVTPHVASKIDYLTGLSKTVDDSDNAVEVLKPSTVETVTKMLVTYVDTSLSAVNPNAKIAHYSVAAKTGTAQIARPAAEGSGYYPDQYLHSFFGYFPAYHPRFLVFLYTYKPQGVNYASQTLTDPFFDIARFLINYYEIPPDR
ncbi:MAG: penicillin-binding protein 2 [Patescibacteria group bacterium]|nr:penicillin-binding protein 2 [Patescibacteria group bacterium]MDE1946013.1 penicillin-binding protein 2 [Patescibacteria group bacterium]